MKLNDELIRIQNGEQGEGMRKILETQITYGEALWVRKGDGENHRAGRTCGIWKCTGHLETDFSFNG